MVQFQGPNPLDLNSWLEHTCLCAASGSSSCMSTLQLNTIIKLRKLVAGYSVTISVCRIHRSWPIIGGRFQKSGLRTVIIDLQEDPRNSVVAMFFV
jgi:hypothetical protein